MDTLHIYQHPGIDPEGFSSNIVEINDIDKTMWLKFDKTYYYPVGGGQPSDIGEIEINDEIVKVLEVKKNDGVWHRISPPSKAICEGMEFVALIDKEFRNPLCKMHTAQHIVSAAADDLFTAKTVGNQIGTERTRIDLGLEDKSIFDRDFLQEEVNKIISQNLEVSMSFEPFDKLLESPLVRVNLDLLPKGLKKLRVITVEGVDICPCAGTHVSNTSQIGEIEITKIKSKGAGKLRVEYSLNDYSLKID